MQIELLDSGATLVLHQRCNVIVARRRPETCHANHEGAPLLLFLASLSPIEAIFSRFVILLSFGRFFLISVRVCLSFGG